MGVKALASNKSNNLVSWSWPVKQIFFAFHKSEKIVNLAIGKLVVIKMNMIKNVRVIQVASHNYR